MTSRPITQQLRMKAFAKFSMEDEPVNTITSDGVSEECMSEFNRVAQDFYRNGMLRKEEYPKIRKSFHDRYAKIAKSEWFNQAYNNKPMEGYELPSSWSLDLVDGATPEGYIVYGEDEHGNPWDWIGRSGKWVRWYGRGGTL